MSVEFNTPYQPEMGQAIFSGSGMGSVDLKRDRGITASLKRLEESIWGEGSSRYERDVDNKIFTLRQFIYSAECDCGFEEQAAAFEKSHPHSPTCFQSEMDKLPNGLFDPGYETLCIKHGIPKEGSAWFCDCPRRPLEEEFCRTHSHADLTCKAARPLFHYKPTDLRIWWYKYIGRGMSANRAVSQDEVKQAVSHCLGWVVDCKENPS